MTYFRRPGSVEDAVLGAIKQLTPAVLRAATGQPRRWLYLASSPVEPGVNITVAQALALDQVLAEKGLPVRFRSLFNAPLRARAREADDLVRALRRLSALLGEAAALSGTAVHWAELGLRERQALARRLHELAEYSMAIRDSLTVPRE